jgi:hypothetical protein
MRVEPTYTRRFETTGTLGTPLGLMDPAAAGPLPGAHLRVRLTGRGGCRIYDLKLCPNPSSYRTDGFAVTVRSSLPQS